MGGAALLAALLSACCGQPGQPSCNNPLIKVVPTASGFNISGSQFSGGKPCARISMMGFPSNTGASGTIVLGDVNCPGGAFPKFVWNYSLFNCTPSSTIAVSIIATDQVTLKAAIQPARSNSCPGLPPAPGATMPGIVRIDDEIITTDDFIRTLKLSGQFEGLVEQMVRDRLTARAARQAGLQLKPEQIQERADEFRRALGLHRAADTNHYLDALGVSLDEFETWITDSLYQEKMLEQVCSEAAVNQYFTLNSPRFDSVEVSHIVLDAEGAAREMMSVLQEEPEAFAEMAREHSIDTIAASRAA
jgi:hypothetical protein